MQQYDIIIVGAGTAGLTAAIYALRAGKSVLVTEGEGFGGQITSSPRVENYPGIASISGNEFADGLVSQALTLGADVELERVEKIIDGAEKTVITDSNSYSCKCVIIATGAKHRPLGIEREEDFSGMGLSYCAVCDGAFFKGQEVAVVGGGDSALQSAIFLSAYCSKVTLIHRRNEFRGEKALVDTLNTKDNVSMLLESEVSELIGDGTLTAVKVKNKSGEEQELPLNGLFVAVGQMPDNKAFADVVKLDDFGYIIADEDCETGTAGIYTAGDCRTKQVRQLTTAAADGAVAALAACKYIDRL
ncbi:MAG: FAD-dependent oxidoreductase [Clostridia bacterium]|nr:FAD-dependent oxidoreductase [Clostridia bacterium]